MEEVYKNLLKTMLVAKKMAEGGGFMGQDWNLPKGRFRHSAV